jgi:hypothetical protein
VALEGLLERLALGDLARLFRPSHLAVLVALRDLLLPSPLAVRAGLFRRRSAVLEGLLLPWGLAVRAVRAVLARRHLAAPESLARLERLATPVSLARP